VYDKTRGQQYDKAKEQMIQQKSACQVERQPLSAFRQARPGLLEFLTWEKKDRRTDRSPGGKNKHDNERKNHHSLLSRLYSPNGI